MPPGARGARVEFVCTSKCVCSRSPGFPPCLAQVSLIRFSVLQTSHPSQMFSTALIVALLGRATDIAPGNYGPYDAPLEPDASPTKSFLSSTLGSHMVLQAATHGPKLIGPKLSPRQAVVWGFVAAGTVVTTVMDGAHTMTTAADASGTWRQTLPATAASLTPHSFSFSATTIGGGVLTARIDDVLFGDVYLCGGQSNMQFAMPAITNASEEAAREPHVV